MERDEGEMEGRWRGGEEAGGSWQSPRGRFRMNLYRGITEIFPPWVLFFHYIWNVFHEFVSGKGERGYNL